jgi:Family of unknown function (DUF6463)
MQRWIGRWIIIVSLLHSTITFFMFWPTIRNIVRSGVWNSVGADPMRGAVVWFFFAGLFMFMLGLTIDRLEDSALPHFSRATGLALLLTSALGIILMPMSGFWLMLPPALALCRKDISRDALSAGTVKPVAEMG